MISTYMYGGNIHANGIRQHYIRYGGRGPKLILLPGITSPAVTWGFVAERLGRAFDTYVLDIRGRGLSESRPDLDYGLDACASDVAGFADAIGADRCHLLGHSMGARIGIRVARRRPAWLDRLVLVDPPVTGPGRRPYPTPLSWYVDSIRLSVKGTDGEGLRPFSPTWTDEERQLRAEWLHTCSEQAIVRAYNDFHETDIHDDLVHIDVPMLLVAAGKGGVIRPEDLTELQTIRPDLATALVGSAGHMIPWDDVTSFFRSFEAFLGAADL